MGGQSNKPLPSSLPPHPPPSPPPRIMYNLATTGNRWPNTFLGGGKGWDLCCLTCRCPLLHMSMFLVAK